MKARHILVIDPRGLEAWANKHNRLTRLERFEADTTDGKKRFADWLQTQPPRTPCAVLIDIPDERFVLEHLPRAGASDTRALIQRRLRQHFPDAVFTTCLPLGAGTDERGLKQVLICALTHADAIQAWLAVIERTSTIVTRIDTPPLLLDNWVRRRGDTPKHQLLLSFTPAGMRQTLFHQGRLRFSRVAAPRSPLLSDCVPFYAGELEQTRNYLLAQRLIGHDSDLPVAILADESDHAALRAITDNADGMSVSFIELSAHTKTRPQPAPANGADALGFLLQLALSNPPAAHYAPPALRREQQLRALGRGLLWTAASIGAALTAAAGLALANAAALVTDTRALEHTRTSVQAEINAIRQQQSPLPAPASDIEAWLSALRSVNGQAAAPALALQRASMILDSVPALQLEQLRWQRVEGEAQPSIAVDLDVSVEAGAADSAYSLQRSIRQLETLQSRLDLAIDTSPYPQLSAAPDSAQPNPRHQLSLRLTLPLKGVDE